MIEAAVIGVGQTKYEAKRRDVSMGGLVRKAIDKAMLAADVDWDAIDAVILGKAPDMFEGVMMPELSLVDAIGANGKPLLRVHTAGSVGGSTAVIAASHLGNGVFRTSVQGGQSRSASLAEQSRISSIEARLTSTHILTLPYFPKCILVS